MEKEKKMGTFMLGVLVCLLVILLIFAIRTGVKAKRNRVIDMDNHCREQGYDSMVDYKCRTIDTSNVSTRRVYREWCSVSCGNFI